MSRPTKPGPPVQRIELMSTGERWHSQALVDDFTGESIPRAPEPAKGPLRDAQAIVDEHNQAKAQVKRALLAQVMPQVLRHEPKPVARPQAKPLRRI